MAQLERVLAPQVDTKIRLKGLQDQREAHGVAVVAVPRVRLQLALGIGCQTRA
jgi:hypothetical protein